MFHHEFIVNTQLVWVRGNVTDLEVFGTVCPSLADELLVRVFCAQLSMQHTTGCNLVRCTPCETVCPVPRSLDFVMSRWHLQQCCTRWTLSSQLLHGPA